MREDFLLGVCVNGRERVVENQDARLTQHGARNRRALLLPARKGYAALADQSVEAFGELAHVVAESGNLRRPLDLGALGLFDSEGYVLGQRLAEEESLLRHVADGGAQLRERVFAHVNVVNEDCAGRRFNYARHEVHKG